MGVPPSGLVASADARAPADANLASAASHTREPTASLRAPILLASATIVVLIVAFAAGLEGTRAGAVVSYAGQILANSFAAAASFLACRRLPRRQQAIWFGVGGAVAVVAVGAAVAAVADIGFDHPITGPSPVDIATGLGFPFALLAVVVVTTTYLQLARLRTALKAEVGSRSRHLTGPAVSRHGGVRG